MLRFAIAFWTAAFVTGVLDNLNAHLNKSAPEQTVDEPTRLSERCLKILGNASANPKQ